MSLILTDSDFDELRVAVKSNLSASDYKEYLDKEEKLLLSGTPLEDSYACLHGWIWAKIEEGIDEKDYLGEK